MKDKENSNYRDCSDTRWGAASNKDDKDDDDD